MSTDAGQLRVFHSVPLHDGPMPPRQRQHGRRRALVYGIHTQGASLEEIRHNVKEAVDCYFDETMTRPELIRLHFVHDEVLKA